MFERGERGTESMEEGGRQGERSKNDAREESLGWCKIECYSDEKDAAFLYNEGDGSD